GAAAVPVTRCCLSVVLFSASPPLFPYTTLFRSLSVTQLEIMPAPPERENKALTWPNWPLKMRTSSSQAEGAVREFAVLTQKFEGDRKSTRLNSSHVSISYAVFCLKKQSSTQSAD